MTALRTPSEPEIMRRAVEAGVARVNKSVPGIVKAYDAATRRATVEPAVHDGLPIPPIPDVPVLFPSGGGFAITWPIAPGDEVDLEFRNLDPSRFLRTGEVSESLTQGRFAVVAYPARQSDAKVAELRVGEDGLHLGTADGSNEVFISTSKVALGGDAAAIAVPRADKIDAQLQQLNAHLTQVNAWLSAFAVHTHLGNMGAPTSPPTPPAPPAPTVPSVEAVGSSVVFLTE